MGKKVILGFVDLVDVPNDYRWYTVVTQYNYEEKYVENVIQAIMGTKLEKLISELYVPIKYIQEERVTAKRKTKKVRKVKGSYASYVFVKCILTETLWNLLRTTTGAAVILTTGGCPTAISQEQIDVIREHQAPEGFDSTELQALQEKLDAKYKLFDESTVDIDTVVRESKEYELEYTKDDGLQTDITE